jgi:hypothetical protein
MKQTQISSITVHHPTNSQMINWLKESSNLQQSITHKVHPHSFKCTYTTNCLTLEQAMTTPGAFMPEQLQQLYCHRLDQELSSHEKQAGTKLKYIVEAHTMRDLPCTIAWPQIQ